MTRRAAPVDVKGDFCGTQICRICVSKLSFHAQSNWRKKLHDSQTSFPIKVPIKRQPLTSTALRTPSHFTSHSRHYAAGKGKFIAVCNFCPRNYHLEEHQRQRCNFFNQTYTKYFLFLQPARARFTPHCVCLRIAYRFWMLHIFLCPLAGWCFL